MGLGAREDAIASSGKRETRLSDHSRQVKFRGEEKLEANIRAEHLDRQGSAKKRSASHYC